PYNILPTSMPSGQPSTWTASSFIWTHSDALVNYAKANDKKIRGHVLIWHDQTPNWFFQGSGTAGRATKQELYARMEAYIKAVFEKYGGDIEWWDVCNEVVDHSITTNGGARSDSMYTRIMEDSGFSDIDRYDYVVEAFKLARKYADLNGGTNVKLYLTDFGIERRFPGQDRSKIDVFEELVNYLIEKDAPIDGIGFQGHFRLYDHPVYPDDCTCNNSNCKDHSISEGIDRFSAIKRKDGKNLTVQVCELDISIFSGYKGEIELTRMPNSVLNQRLTDLGNTYRDFFEMFEEKFDEGKLDLVLIWGIADGHSWLNNHPREGRTDYPLLFSRNNKAKEAYWRLVQE
ncbi:MAG: endo-1,4-beta-xylanase, partial [Treponema sp.]|nr:endo-1,4-beta-xylanase [Treponema sp.]